MADTQSLRHAAVERMLGAKSIAVVGASSRPNSLGSRMILEANRGSARVHLVNPRYERIGEQVCLPSIADLDEPVDLALLGVPDSVLVEQLQLAADSGARSAVLFGSAHGIRDQVSQVAAEAGMALCGAGCMGFINNVTGVRALGYLEAHPVAAGNVSLITHSGSAFSLMLRANRGFGFRLAVSSGQELITDAADYVEYALDDPGTQVLALLLETPRSLPRLQSALRRAADQDVPVVILPVGGSPRGSAMVAAHSGALAGEAAGWQAFCARNGAVHVRDLAEFTDTIEIFAAGRRARRGRIATVHDSGAERALTVDLADDLGIEFAALSATTMTGIDSVLEVGLEAANPLDVWGTGANSRELFAKCLQFMAEDPNVAVTALAVDLVPELDGDSSYPDALVDVVASTAAPMAVLTSVPSAIDQAAAAYLREQGIPVLEGARTGLRAMAHLANWPLRRADEGPAVDAARKEKWTTAIAAGDFDAFDLLADYGIPVVQTVAAETADGVLAAAQTIGYPVALKTRSADHKSDVGGVVLGLSDEAELRDAYVSMASRLGGRVSVSAMARPGVEISVGYVRDPVFGPLLVVAAGGTLVELLQDRAVVQVPLDAEEATAAVQGLRVQRLLGGWRGQPANDVAALSRAIVAMSDLAAELGGHLDAVEANPIIVSPDGAVAVDVLLVTPTA